MGMKLQGRLAGAVIAVAFAAPAAGQSLSLEDFARHGVVNEVALSPRGDFVALAVPTESGTATELRIVPIDASAATKTLRFRGNNHVTDVTWTADDQLTVSRATMEPLVARPQSYGELMSSDLQGKNQEVLFAYMPNRGTWRGHRKDEGFATLVQALDREPGKALVSYRCGSCGETPDAVVYKVDTQTGGRREVERVPGPATFVFDQAGVARVAMSLDADDRPTLRYRPSPTDDWQPMPEALAGFMVEAGVFAADDNTLYAVVSDSGEPARLYRMDLAAGTRELLAGREDVEIAYLLRGGRNGIPFAVGYDASGPKVEYVDPTSEWALLHQSLLQRFAGQMVRFNGFSRDDRRVLFFVHSDRNPGAWYLLDREAGKLLVVAEVAPWIDPAKLAPTRPIEFQARDGTTLHGFLTTNGAEGPRPTVVLPHGGPHGVHDTWAYDDDVQMLAELGYSVLRVNFRGSGGRGRNFLEAGWREWGGLIQDDIADGVHWAIGQGLVDPSRICIYGASFGGYSALMNPVRYPDLYQCAIGNVGVYDLPLMFDEGDIRDRRSGRRYLERVLGTDQGVLAVNSPARHVDKIGVPVLLAQGAVDKRVPMEQFAALASAFEDSGRPAETLVIKGEGHGFYDPDNRARFYRKMGDFLDRHIGAGATGAAGVR